MRFTPEVSENNNETFLFPIKCTNLAERENIMFAILSYTELKAGCKLKKTFDLAQCARVGMVLIQQAVVLFNLWLTSSF